MGRRCSIHPLLTMNLQLGTGTFQGGFLSLEDLGKPGDALVGLCPAVPLQRVQAEGQERLSVFAMTLSPRPPSPKHAQMPHVPFDVQGPGHPGRQRRGSAAAMKHGRWNDEEHAGFLAGMRQHGRAWKTISEAFVKTRTPEQIRIHAQKHFNRLEKARRLRGGSKKKCTSRPVCPKAGLA